jgi:uncharacterized protein (TIGR00730 family)
VDRLDRKMANAALKEMRYAFGVFAHYRNRRKVSIFGSARTHPQDPEYALALEFSRLMAAQGWMVVTGAGPGIMQAGNEGAGPGASFGVNIVLPFENQANPFVLGDPKLVNFRYFFTRKLMFMKESDAFVLFPGGYGTMDELYELLTLVQTGKSDLHPIVLLDKPGGDYWDTVLGSVVTSLLQRGYIDRSDSSFFYSASDPSDALRHIDGFYRVYHSQRYVEGRLVLRLRSLPEPAVLERLSAEFQDILTGPITPAEASPTERAENDVPDLPRLSVPFDRSHYGRLRLLIDAINNSSIGT